MSIVYTSDFTVGSDVALTSYTGGSLSSTWTSIRNGSSASVNATRDRVETTSSTPEEYTCYVDFTGCPTGDQEISATVGVLSNYDAGIVIVRAGTGTQGYGLYRGSTSVWELYRLDGGSYTFLTSYSVSTTNGSAIPVKLKAVGTGATVTVTATINGSEQTAYNDSSGSRRTSGYPGLGISVYGGGADSGRYVDDVSIDNLSSGDTITVTAADSVGLGDSAVASVNKAAAAADSLGFGDSSSALTTRTSAAADSLGFGDSSAATTTKVAVAADSLSFGDSASSATAESVDAADSVGFGDSAEAAVGVPSEAEDSLGLGDSAAAVSVRVSVGADSLGFADSASAALTTASAGADSLSLQDSASAVVTKTAEGADSLQFGDSAVAEIPAGIPANGADSVAFGDSALATATLVSAAEDSVGFGDSAVSLTTRAAQAADSLSFDDSAAGSVAQSITAVAEDSLAFGDSAIGEKASPFQMPQITGADVVPGEKRKRKTVREDILEVIAEMQAPPAVKAVAAARVPASLSVEDLPVQADELRELNTAVSTFLVRVYTAVYEDRARKRRRQAEILVLL